ncbi:MAG: winged helix-turn-helix domain-containing protein [Cyanobium sp.]
MTLPVLLVGAVAQALAPRLRLSGYEPLQPGPDGLEAIPLEPTAVEQAALPPVAQPLAVQPLVAPASPATPTPRVVPSLSAVVLSPGEDSRLPALRQRWGAVPMLLGILEDDVAGRARTLLCGADDFWLAGLAPSDLLTRLRLHRQITRQTPPMTERLVVADLQLIPSLRQVRRGSRLLTLTAREYQLLLLLLEHRGQVLSRDRILARVWPDQQGAGSNVIEVYVRYLRQKLEEAGERRLIHTVRGQGYCLNDGPPRAETC